MKVEIVRVGAEAEAFNAVEAFRTFEGSREKREADEIAKQKQLLDTVAAGYDETASGLRYQILQKGDGKKGEKPGKKDEAGKNINEPNEGGLGEKGTGQNDDLDGELYEIYKQQSQLRQQLETAIKDSGEGNKKNIATITIFPFFPPQ
jgi:hypothetical protein